ncbi:cystathionine gamma-synthase [Exidia glandulosa HHB12029]|uniref:Cystathionine gamma-synthase n=1 Tax=Exidia glandulosa HHB12029 TaxID=1314781 RepID=A0A165QVQ6_EXIGL|nr:cystathionine gamma-synthase [Exidia glandulosa HHB12029]
MLKYPVALDLFAAVTMSSGLGTVLLHSDDDPTRAEVAPSISVTTTFRHSKDVDLKDFDPIKPHHHVYSRYTQDVTTRVERVLGQLHGEGKHALTFSSGLSAVFTAMVHTAPKRVCVSGGYFGSHASIAVYGKAAQRTVPLVPLDAKFEPGDVCWLETPVNPTGEARDIQHYADKIHAVGGKLCVDATFAPPPLSDPFKFGADIVLHSGTKYFGGHSDLLCGVLVVKSPAEWKELWDIRVYLGNTMGSFESWLLLRSLRTLHVRVPQQSKTATALAQWLYKHSQTPRGETWDGVPGGVVHSVQHASLQTEKFVKEQLPNGFPPTFSVMLHDIAAADEVAFHLHIFTPATSLGGVESLIEQRFKADGITDRRLLRISVGLEELEDLKGDLRQALRKVADKKAVTKL